MKKAALTTAVLIICASFLGTPKQQRIIIAGSSCMGRMAGALAREYSKQRDIRVEAQLGGTQLGLMALEQEICDIASVSRPLTEQEKAWVNSYPVALDAIAVIVHPENDVSRLSMRQMAEIYGGAIKNWAQVGGEDMPIVVIGREAGSGTRAAFEDKLGLSSDAAHAQEHSETGMLRTAVAMTKGAIGYISFDYINGEVKPLLIDGVLPCEGTVLSGQYPFVREFLLCTRKGDDRRETADFIRYAVGERGRKVISWLNMIPFPQEGALR